MTHHFVLGTAGHVDHGKTALIKALTDIDCDTHKEEKERGITINLGFSHLDLPSGNSIGIIDVPGHKDFIRTMVAGAFGIDFVLLVIAADSGVMPQTSEHLNIINMLGVSSGVVALTKADLVDDDMIEMATLEIEELLENNVLKGAPIIPVSSVNQKGLQELVRAIDDTLIKIPQNDETDLFRMYIDRIFSVKGIGNIVTGSVLNGPLSVGDELIMFPGGGKKLKVKEIERHGSNVNIVHPGDRAALNLSGLKSQDYKRGMILLNKQIETTRIIDATLKLFTDRTALGIWSTVLFLTGTFETLAKIHLLDKDELNEGDEGIVQIHLENPFVLINGDKFIIRNSSDDLTLGGGTIFDLHPDHHRRRTPKLISALTTIVDAAKNRESLITLIKFELDKASQAVNIKELSKKFNISQDDLLSICKENEHDINIYGKENSKILVSINSEEFIKEKILNILDEWHQANLLFETGLGVKALSTKLMLSSNSSDQAFLASIVEKLINTGEIREFRNTFILANHSVTIDQKTSEQLDWLEEKFKNAGMNKVLLPELEKDAREKKINKDRLHMMMKYLNEKRILYYFDGDYLHKDVLGHIRSVLLNELIKREQGINEKEFRLLINGTKKICQLALGILQVQGVVEMKTFYIHITDKGRMDAE